jgi:hypothetical protein
MGMAGGLSGEKANDVPEDQVVDRLRQLMGDRLRQAYVDVIGPDRTFASSYHIKVIVRDGQEVWLSSGNLQTTNQPNIQPAEDGERRLEPLRRFNREWHIVFRNDALAATFEGYLLHDLQTAEQNPGNEPPDEEIFVPALAPAPDVELLERRRARYFRRQVFASDPGSPVRVQALLTPDNYLDHVIPLVQSARERLFIQNQSLSLLQGDRNEERFLELWGAIKERQDAGVELRMIFRVHTFDEDGARSIKERLVDFGFRPASILVQENCHTKGVVVDSAVVLVGSHNWTNQGTIANRDASLIIRQPAIARYYEAIFLFDWDTLTREPRPPRPQRGRGPGGDERLEGAPPAAGGPAATARTTIRELLDG